MLLRSLPVYILKQLFFSISVNSGRIFTSPLRCSVNILKFYTYGLLTKCEVKMTGYWPSSFLHVYNYMDQDRVDIYSEKRTRSISSHYSFQKKEIYSCRTWRVVQSRQGNAMLSAQVTNQCRIWFILPAYGASHTIK